MNRRDDKRVGTEQRKLSIKLSLKKKGLPNKDFLLAQVFFCKKKKCVDVRGMFKEEDARKKGFYYKRL
nr:hypothetical protein BSM_22210 [uncultured archaeon]